ncbi:hypothetical protein ABT404_44040 [Streptomyces hyaluromycini]|uniref:Uncharacterized protein n=1 Tax=Streptomyces hyaluromycini TaxID=1377993 RepID=A0ABV1XBH4_9ACTN
MIIARPVREARGTTQLREGHIVVGTPAYTAARMAAVSERAQQRLGGDPDSHGEF